MNALPGLTFLLGCCTNAQSQEALRPGGVDPRQSEKQIEAIEAEQNRLKKPPLRMPHVARPEFHGGRLPLFQLRSVSIDGAHAIPGEELAAVYRQYLGRTVTQADLEAMVGALSDRYRDAGYHLSRAIVPAQDIKDGNLRIQVIEGSITEVLVNGEGAEKLGVPALLEPLKDEHPSRLGTVERQLFLANETPGVRIVDTALEEIGTGTGAFRLIIKAETWRIFTTLGLDNYGTRAVGPLQAYSSTYFNSYFVSGDAIGVALSTVPDATRDLRFGRLSYDMPVGLDGVRIGATASYNEVWPNDDRRAIDTRTINQFYQLRGSISPLQSRKTALALTAALDFVDESEKDTLGLTYDDHVRAAVIKADYKLNDWLNGWNYATVIVRQGINGLGASTSDDPWLSREGASPTFSVLNFAYIRYQQFSDAWSLKTSLVGQFASGPLLSSQAFYLGGAAFGPGYYSGDNGLAGLVELRFDEAINSKWLKGYQLYGFVDGGEVWNKHEDKQSLSSAGIGVRFHMLKDFHAGIEFAVPMSYTSKTDQFQESRLLFSMSNSLKLCPDRSQMRCF